MTIEQQAALETEAREAAWAVATETRTAWLTEGSADVFVGQFCEGFIAAAEPREREIAELRAALAEAVRAMERYMKYHEEKFYADRNLKPTGLYPAIADAKRALPEEAIPPARELLQEEGTLSAEVESLSLDWCNEITRSAPVAYCGLRAGHDGAHRSEGLPELCYTPSECAGRTSCPRRPACSS